MLRFLQRKRALQAPASVVAPELGAHVRASVLQQLSQYDLDATATEAVDKPIGLMAGVLHESYWDEHGLLLIGADRFDALHSLREQKREVLTRFVDDVVQRLRWNRERGSVDIHPIIAIAQLVIPDGLDGRLVPLAGFAVECVPSDSTVRLSPHECQFSWAEFDRRVHSIPSREPEHKWVCIQPSDDDPPIDKAFLRGLG